MKLFWFAWDHDSMNQGNTIINTKWYEYLFKGILNL
jgi:hypothetical protein